MVDATTQTEWSWLHDIAQQSKASFSPEPSLESPQVTAALELQTEDYDTSTRATTDRDAQQEDPTNNCTSSKPVVKELLDLISSEESSSSTDERDSSADEEGFSSPAPYPRLSSAVSLPWPSILSYLRESESLASSHFKIFDNGVTTRGSDSSTPEEMSDPRQHHPSLCHFCEQPAPSFSLLPANLSKEPEFCCEDYRDYCVLVAAYTKRMMDASAKQLPGRIRFKYEEPAVKMSAQEKALEKVRKKRKWEVMRKLQLEKLKSSSFYGLSRQVKTVQFSLSSPTGLASNGVASTPQWNDPKATIPRRQSEPFTMPTRSHPLSGKNLNKPRLLSQTTRSAHSTTAVRKSRVHKAKEVEYPDRQEALLTLPDGTNQCYYPSRRLAVIVFPIYQGVLATLLFQDMDRSGPVGYCDELGRAWLTGDQASLWFVSTPHDCFMFDSAGRCKHWEWRNVASYSMVLPLLLRVNKHIILRYNSQDDILLTFTSEQVTHKLKFYRKVKDLGSLSKDSSPESKFKSQLNELTCRFNGHLHSVQQALRAMKAEQRRHLPPLDRLQPVKKARSKSTGTVSFKS